MAWRKINIKEKDLKFAEREFRKKARFLIDENLPLEATEYLREEGWNVKCVKEEGLGGKDDASVLSFAWKENRIIITSDSKFPGGLGFKEQGNPGIIILPNASIDNKKFYIPFLNAIDTVGSLGGAFKKTTLRFNQDGTTEVTRRNFDTGTIETTKYRLGRNGNILEWV